MKLGVNADVCVVQGPEISNVTVFVALSQSRCIGVCDQGESSRPDQTENILGGTQHSL